MDLQSWRCGDLVIPSVNSFAVPLGLRDMEHLILYIFLACLVLLFMEIDRFPMGGQTNQVGFGDIFGYEGKPHTTK